MAGDRYARSHQWRARAVAVTPGGSQTRSKVYGPHDYPKMLARGVGCHVWDVDDNKYIDWVLGLGAVGLGHTHPRVQDAVHTHLFRGAPTMPLPHYLEAQYAEKLLAALAWPEQARFVKTGSEATEGAMMIARRATGRELVLSIGYHGWHTAHAESSECIHLPEDDAEAVAKAFAGDCGPCDAGSPHHTVGAEGISDPRRRTVADLHEVSDAGGVGLVECIGMVAAVIVEVGRFRHPPVGYLGAIRALCDRYAAVMILDECVTGFRWALGGAGQFYGVVPDLACFGKAMANGYPLAAIVGRRELMEHAVPLVSSTFGGETISLAAAEAVLEVYQSEPVIETMWERGVEFQASFDAPGFRCTGVPVHPVLEVVDSAWDNPLLRLPPVARMAALLEQTAARGVLFHPSGFNVSFAHTREDVGLSLEVARLAATAAAAPAGTP